MTTGQITLSTTAQRVVSATPYNFRSVTVRNFDPTAVIYFGNSSVSPTTGFPLNPLESWTGNIGGEVWVVAASGTPLCAFIDGG